MKNRMKAVICGAALVTSLALGMTAEAGSIPSHMVPLQTYATKKVTCYLSPGGASKGWIDQGDYVIVNQIRSDGWAYGSYPVKNGRTSRWFRVDDLLNNPSFKTLERMSPDYKIKVYKNYSYNGEIGSVWGNEDIWVVSNLGDVWQIVYKVSSGGYKMGWVPYWDCLEKYTQWQGYAVSKSTAYTNAALTSRNGTEYVSAGDAVTVLNEQGNAYYVRYPLMSGGTKDRWVAKSAISRTKPVPVVVYNQWQGYAVSKTTAYTNAALTSRNGTEYVSAGDAVTVLNEQGNAYYVRYPLMSGGTKDRWVAKSAISRTKPVPVVVYNQWQGYAVSKSNVYINASLNTRYVNEYVSAGDAVTVLNEQGNAYYVRYPLMSGGTKDRWIAKSAISKTKPVTGKTDTDIAKTVTDGMNIALPVPPTNITLVKGKTIYALKPNTVTQGVTYSGGVYVEGFKVSKALNNMVTVSFDVYNTSHTNGVVSIYNQKGTLIKQVILDPFNQGITSLKDWAHKAGGMFEGFWNLAQGNSSYLNYKNDFASTQKHIQNEKIPVGSKIVITNNFKVSPDLLLYDVVSHVVDGTSTLISIIKTCAPDNVKQKIIEETKLQLVEKLKNGTRGYVLDNYLKIVASGTIKSLTKSDLKKLYEGIKKEIIANDLEAFEKLAVQNAFTKYAPAVAGTVVKTMAKSLLPGFATFGIEAIFSVNKIGNYTNRISDMFYKTKAQPFTFTIAP